MYVMRTAASMMRSSLWRRPWSLVGRLFDPRYRRLHVIFIAVALALHLAMHYATYWAPSRELVAGLPYFRMHVLHEAEFLLVVAYAGVVVGLWGGLIAIAVTGLTSIPFIAGPLIMPTAYGRATVEDQALQVGLVMFMGLMITLLYDRDKRRRQAEQDALMLREVDRVKNNFMSMAAHELRTPLTTLFGFSELLLTREVPPDQQRRWLESIYGETRRLTALVDDLLNVARIESGKLAVQTERLNAAQVVVDAVQSLGGVSAKHTLSVQLPPGLPDIRGDQDKLVQVMNNLLSNAMKYSPAGGQVIVTARLAPDGANVEFGVRDHGIGIAPEDQVRLFSTFYRVRRRETERVPGTGLGLYIVKSLVELMGGRVWLDSAVGKGSAFTFTVPLWEALEQAASGPGAQAGRAMAPGAAA